MTTKTMTWTSNEGLRYEAELRDDGDRDIYQFVTHELVNLPCTCPDRDYPALACGCVRLDPLDPPRRQLIGVARRRGSSWALATCIRLGTGDDQWRVPHQSGEGWAMGWNLDAVLGDARYRSGSLASVIDRDE